MLDAERLLGNLLGGTLSRALGGRGSSIFRGGSLTTKANVGIGLLGVAFAAFEHYQQQSRQPAEPTTGGPPPPPPPVTTASRAGMPPPPPPAASAERQADAIVLIRAMIAAAQSDGRIDEDERSRIAQATAGLSADERTFLDTELASPHSIEQLAAAGRPGIAAEIYAAASHAIVADSDAERAWLERLADALRLDAQTRQTLNRQLTTH